MNSRSILWLVTILGLFAAPALAAESELSTPTTPLYARAFTKSNRVGLSITNYGFFGTNLTDRTPSMEYPLGSGLEHLVRAGIWVGARTLPNGADTTVYATTHVTTGCLDGYYNVNPGSSTGSEFTPVGRKVARRSQLKNSPDYDPRAISEGDLVADCNDEGIQNITGIEPHVPLHLQVRTEAYSWSFNLASSFVVLHVTVRNTGPLLRDVYLGMYSQLVSNNKRLYAGWPPSSGAGNGPRSWFYATQLDWVDSLKMIEEHFCLGQAACRTEDVNPAWAGIKYLGSRTESATARPRFKWWAWSPASEARNTDLLRYGILTDTTPAAPTSNIKLGTDSPIEILTVGPFLSLPTDSTVSADFAFVGGIGPADLATHADFAQLAFDLNYILPQPPPSPRMRIVSAGNGLDLYWDDSPDTTYDPTSLHPDKHDFEGYRVYLGHGFEDVQLVAEADLRDSVPPNTGLERWTLPEPARFPDDPISYKYHYRIDGLRDGFKYYAAVTSFDKGDLRVPSLESGVVQNLAPTIPGPPSGNGGGVSVFPNPYRVEARWDAGTSARSHYLWFVGLPARARLRIFTLGGDLVKDIRFDAATYHGEGANGVNDPSLAGVFSPPQLSGSMAAWNLLSDHDQAVGTGIYLFSVEDLSNGKRQVGKFAVVKADRQ